MKSEFERCTGCGELKQYCNFNSNGECENCSIICESCFRPAREVGDVNEDRLCFECQKKEENPA